MSGAGLSTALKCLEDLGYEAVDNLPMNMVDALVGQGDLAPGRSRSRWMPGHGISAPTL